MTRNDINRIYTEKVAELLAQGYQIHTSTMSGSQGEIAHIDLCKDDEVLRVLLRRDNDFRAAFSDIIVITVGRNTERLYGSWYETIWDNRLEVISEIKLAQISDTYFTTIEEAKEMSVRRVARWKRSWDAEKGKEYGDAYKSIALRWLRRQPRMKSCKLEDIDKMVKKTHDDGTTSYEITAKSRTFSLAARHSS